MPFYIRTSSRRPWWHIAIAGGAAILVWTVVQAVLLGSRAHAPHPSALRLGLTILTLTLMGAGVAGGLYWLLGWQPLARLTPLRWTAATVAVLIYLIGLTLAASQGEPAGPWSRVTRPTFLLSSLLLALVIGWLIAKDPFGLGSNTRRVYLTPSEYAALPEGSRERLRIDVSAPAEKDQSVR